MADVRKAFAPLGTLGRWLLALAMIEAAWLLAEMWLSRAVGQQAIASAMITAPRSATALLGAAAVLVRIIAHALFPALFTFLLTLTLTRRALGRCLS